MRYRRNNTVYESIRAPCLAKVFIQRFLVPFLSESGKPSGVFIVKANCLKNIHEVKMMENNENDLSTTRDHAFPTRYEGEPAFSIILNY